jgi:hypothetical protein
VSRISTLETVRHPELAVWEDTGREAAKCAVGAMVVVEVLEAIEDRIDFIDAAGEDGRPPHRVEKLRFGKNNCKAPRTLATKRNARELPLGWPRVRSKFRPPDIA